MAGVDARTGVVQTGDGVSIRYVEAGDGPDLLLVAGWTMTADLWRAQVEEFSRTHHVVAYDHRGHGLSGAPDHGYRVSRLAADARELIVALGLTHVTWVGHSLGCSVAWAYWDLYGGADLGRLVLIDGPAVLMSMPDWPDGMAAETGAAHDAAGMAQFIAALRGPQATAVATGAFDAICGPAMPAADKKLIVERSLEVGRQAAAALMLSHITQDWRDVLPRITVPVLLIGAEGSIFPATAIENLGSVIPDSSSVVIPAAEGGSHLAFYENPSAVNTAIRAFLDTRGGT